MDEHQFDGAVRAIETAVSEAIVQRLTDLGLKFDANAFRDQSSADIGQLARDALFFGADAYPEFA